jgi:hypothetical protein
MTEIMSLKNITSIIILEQLKNYLVLLTDVNKTIRHLNSQYINNSII